MNGSPSQNTNGKTVSIGAVQDELLQLNLELKNLKYDERYAKFHGDRLIGVSWNRQRLAITEHAMATLTDEAAGQGRTQRTHSKFGELCR